MKAQAPLPWTVSLIAFCLLTTTISALDLASDAQLARVPADLTVALALAVVVPFLVASRLLVNIGLPRVVRRTSEKEPVQ